MKTNFKLFMLLMTIISTLFLISSSSWLSIWMWLEMNLIMFISYMINNNLKLSIESSLIYFLIQTMASMLFLFSLIMMMLYNNLYKLMILSILIKMGSAPFHYWLPLIIEGLEWMNFFILLTWQKINPLIIMFYINKFKILLMFIILSMLIGSLNSLNYNSLKKILTFSSINQLSWLMLSLNYNKFLILYLIFYFYMMFIIIKSMYSFNLNYLNQMFNLNLKNNFFKLLIFSNFLSLSGLPPFLGFFPKMIIIMKFMNWFILFLLLMFSLIMMYMYMRIIFSLLMLNSIKLNKINNKISNLNFMILFLINNLSIIPIIYIY